MWRNTFLHILLYDFWGKQIIGTKRVVLDFIYGNNLKPDFGLDYLFIYDPLPFHEEPEMERLLSKNNMIECVDGNKWIYTFNENGLPSTIEVKWKDIETEEPMLLKLSYKKI